MSGKVRIIKPSIKGGRKKSVNKKLNLTKESKSGILVIKDQHGVQAFIYQFNLDTQGN